MKVKYLREFKEIDTEEKAYFLGLLYSDGSIFTCSDLSRGSYCTKLKLSDNDSELIENLVDIFPFFRLFEEHQNYTYKNVTTKKIYVGMRAYCKELLEDLVSHGMLQAKSTWNKDNLHLPILTDTLMKHFIRGLADGDGSYSWCRTGNRKYMSVTIIDASLPFTEELCKWFNLNNLSCNVEKDKSYYRIRFRRKEDIITYRDLIIKDAKIYMERKYQKIINYSGSIIS